VRKQALLTFDLACLLATLPGSPAGLRDRALLLVGFVGAFRRSELVALDIGDVKWEDNRAWLVVRGSKTNPIGNTGERKLILAAEDAAICPLRALRAWIEFLAVYGVRAGPLFRPVSRTGKPIDRRLSAQCVALIVKQAARRAGIDADALSGHSLRAGFITSAALAGAQEHEIQRVSGHKSADVLRTYIRDSGAGQARAVRAAFRLRKDDLSG
jgi:integrase